MGESESIWRLPGQKCLQTGDSKNLTGVLHSAADETFYFNYKQSASIFIDKICWND